MADHDNYNTLSDEETLKEEDSVLGFSEDQKTLRHTRDLVRQLENDHIRDELEDAERKKRIEWERPGGLSKFKDEYAPKGDDGKSGVLTALTSDDPMEGLGKMMHDQMAYAMERGENNLRHKRTNRKTRHTFQKDMGYSKKDAKLLADVLENETKYGTESLERARQRAFQSQFNKDNGQSKSQEDDYPSMPI